MNETTSIKTADLIGRKLDAAVAIANGQRVQWIGWAQIVGILESDETEAYSSIPAASTDWSEGGPIIERERIDVRYYGGEGWYASARLNEHGDPDEWPGVTPLVAAMRCFVASKLGDTVDIPVKLSEFA